MHTVPLPLVEVTFFQSSAERCVLAHYRVELSVRYTFLPAFKSMPSQREATFNVYSDRKAQSIQEITARSIAAIASKNEGYTILGNRAAGLENYVQ